MTARSAPPAPQCAPARGGCWRRRPSRADRGAAAAAAASAGAGAAIATVLTATGSVYWAAAGTNATVGAFVDGCHHRRGGDSAYKKPRRRQKATAVGTTATSDHDGKYSELA